MSKVVSDDLALGAAKSVNKHLGRINKLDHFQGVAATLAGAHLFTAEFDGSLGDLTITLGAAAGAGESMVVDVLKNGATVLTGTQTVDSTSGKVIDLGAKLDVSKVSFLKGDVFTVSRTYVAGGTPTPIKDSRVIAEPTLGWWRT